MQFSSLPKRKLNRGALRFQSNAPALWTASGAVALQVEKCLVTTSGWLQFPELRHPELRHTLTGSGGTLESYVSLGGAVAGTSFELDGMSLVLQ